MQVSSLASQVTSGAARRKASQWLECLKTAQAATIEYLAERREGEREGFASEALLSSDRSWSRSETTVRGMAVAVEAVEGLL